MADLKGKSSMSLPLLDYYMTYMSNIYYETITIADI